jgi:hypothetical protein
MTTSAINILTRLSRGRPPMKKYRPPPKIIDIIRGIIIDAISGHYTSDLC